MVNEKAMNPKEAGEFMHVLLPERTPQQWLNWLGNNRDEEREAVVRIPYSVKGRSRIIYDGDELIKAATVLAVKSNLFRNRVGSTGVLVAPAEKIMTSPAFVEDAVPVIAPASEPEAPVIAAPAQSPRPGLEMALKIVRDLPPGITAEQALLIALNMVQ